MPAKGGDAMGYPGQSFDLRCPATWCQYHNQPIHDTGSPRASDDPGQRWWVGKSWKIPVSGQCQILIVAHRSACGFLLCGLGDKSEQGTTRETLELTTSKRSGPRRGPWPDFFQGNVFVPSRKIYIENNEVQTLNFPLYSSF